MIAPLQLVSLALSAVAIIISVVVLARLGERTFVGRLWLRVRRLARRLTCRHRRAVWSTTRGNTRVCCRCDHSWRDRELY